MFSIFNNFSTEKQPWEQSPLLCTSFVGVTADVDELSASITARQHVSAGCLHACAVSNT